MLNTTLAHGAGRMALVFALTGTCVDSAAQTQAVKYEFFVLAPLDGYAESGGLGINNIAKTVVGWSGPGGIGGVRRATLWRVCSNIGALPYSAPVDLAILAGIPVASSLDSEAREINEVGVASGIREKQGSGGGSYFNRSFVWDTANAIYAEIGTFSGGPTDKSEAWGINDAANPVVVGWAQDSFDCEGLSANGPTTAFQLVWTNGVGALIALPAGITGDVSEAHDIRTTGTQRAVGGRSDCSAYFPCFPTSDAVEWDGSIAVALDEMGASNGSVGWAMNEAGMSVGSINAQSACVTHAAIWLNATTAIDLSIASGYPADAETEARGIAEPLPDGQLLVVGRELSEPYAILWTGTPDGASYTWTYQHLEDLVSSISAWSFRDAFDVTDDGWIVARGGCGTVPGSALAFRPAVAGLLCPGDINRSGVVDGSDLAVLLGSWGASATLPTCSYLADIDIDGDVDASDLGLLLGAWNTACNYCPEAGLMPGAAERIATSAALEGAPGLETALEIALNGLGFSSVDEFVAWASGASEQDLATVGLALSIAMSAQGGL